MTAAAKPRKNVTKPGTAPSFTSQRLTAQVKFWEGAIVALNPATGKWVKAVSTDPNLICYGAARVADYFDNSAGALDADEMIVDSGTFLLISSGLTDADEGKTVYVSDDQTFTLTPSATAPVMGKLLEVVSSTSGFVEVQPPGAHALAISPIDAPADLTDAAATIQITAGRWRVLPAATLTVDRILTIGTTGARLGDRMRITRRDLTAFDYSIVNGGGGAGTLAILPPGRLSFADLWFDGTDWKVAALGALSSPISGLIAGTALTDAAATVVPGGGNWYTMPAATLTTDRVITLGTAGALSGDEMVISRVDVTGHQLSVANGGAGAGTLAVLPGGSQGWVRARFDGTNWIFVAASSLGHDWTIGAALTDTATQTISRSGRKSWRTIPTLSQGGALTVNTTGAQKGDEMLITRTSTDAETYAVINGGAGAGTLVTLPASKVNFARIRFDGTNWQLMACGTQ